MKGHIFNLLEEFIIETAGMENYEGILVRCSFDTSEGFINTVTYPDEQLYEIVGHTVDVLGITAKEAHMAFGKWIMPHLSRLVPPKFMDHSHPGSFLKTLDHIHKVELKKLYPDATPPVFSYSEIDDEHAVLTYISSRRLFDLVEGCLEGVSGFYNTPMSISRTMKPDSSASCDFMITYS